MFATLTPPAVQARHSRKYHRALAAWSKMLAAVAFAARAADAFEAACADLPDSEKRLHFLATVGEEAGHLAFALHRDCDLLGSSTPPQVDALAEKIASRLERD